MVPGLLRVAIVYLDACVFLGLDSPVFREKINYLIRILKVHGETWPLSKKIAEDVQAVVNEYLDPKDEPDANLHQWNTTGADALSAIPIFGSSTAEFESCSFPHPELESISLNYCELEQAMFPLMPTFMVDGSGQAA